MSTVALRRFERVVLVGDVGGHRRPFFDVLSRFGISTSSMTIPENLCVVQLGDLVGPFVPASEQIIEVVDALMENNPGRWIQLMGNWEARELDYGYPFTARREDPTKHISCRHVEMMERWWQQPGGSVAAVIRAYNSMPYLVTHAGMTSGLWRDLGEPSLDETAAMLNALGRQGHPAVFSPSESVLGSPVAAGPLWVWPAELWGSWLEDGPMPFSQVVGHAQPFSWRERRWWDDLREPLYRHATANEESRVTWWSCPASDWGVIHSDCGVHAKSPSGTLRAHVFGNATVSVAEIQRTGP